MFQTTLVSMLMKSADGTKLGGMMTSQEEKIIQRARFGQKLANSETKMLGNLFMENIFHDMSTSQCSLPSQEPL